MAISMCSCNSGEKQETSVGETSVDTTSVQTTGQPATNVPPVFDQEKATRLGADEYGMKQYVMAILQQGTNQGIDEAAKAQLQKAHLKRIETMASEGKLLLAGPFLDDGFDRGIFIFNTASVDTARMWTATDPYIKLGQLQLELHPWYGSAALQELSQMHMTIQKKSVTE